MVPRTWTPALAHRIESSGGRTTPHPIRRRSMPHRRILVALALLPALAFSLYAAVVPPVTRPSHGSAVAGKKIFQSKCVPCHKQDGSGGFKLTGNPTPDWRDTTRMDDPD